MANLHAVTKSPHFRHFSSTNVWGKKKNYFTYLPILVAERTRLLVEAGLCPFPQLKLGYVYDIHILLHLCFCYPESLHQGLTHKVIGQNVVGIQFNADAITKLCLLLKCFADTDMHFT